MARAYAQDLRDRVIDAVESGGLSRRAAARRFGVSAAAAIKWLQRFQRTGERRSAGTGGHRPSKVEPHRAWVLAVLAAQPDITLAALAARLLRGARRAGRHQHAVAVLQRGRDQLQKKVWWPPNRSGQTSCSAASSGSARKASLIPAGSSSWTRPGPRRT